MSPKGDSVSNTDLGMNGRTRTATTTKLLSDSESKSSCSKSTSLLVLFKFNLAPGVSNATALKHSGVRNSVALLLAASTEGGVTSVKVVTDASVLRRGGSKCKGDRRTAFNGTSAPECTKCDGVDERCSSLSALLTGFKDLLVCR